MSVRKSTCVVLAAVPQGVPGPEIFTVATEEVGDPGPGEALVQVSDLSLDPYLRTTLVGRHLDDPVVPIGGVIPGRAVGQVVASADPSLPAGSWVLGETGWREYALLPTTQLRPIAVPDGVPRSAALGALGMPGLTAYAAVQRHLRPVAGDTVVVGSATGGVGSVAGPLAKLAGARTVALVGDDAKAKTAVQTLGYDAAVVRTAPDWIEQLAAACPDRINGYLHMGDAQTLEVVMESLAVGARVSLCGLMDQTNGGPRTMLRAGAVMAARAVVHGMVVYDHFDLAAEQVEHVAGLLRTGQLHLHEDRYQGLASAPEAFARLMSGRNHGKVVVQVAALD
ncbi:MDR family NADP-dependent oxidoreductase [Melissospora conviva]|uniref:MDR family NADP-dependent oxidoreductase n=1 Tax=Melissospora conviva TaxID=3388432 RepID=UPI003B806232